MNAFNKDILRSIKGSFGRFAAILGIVALGVGFFGGMRMACPDMKLSADVFFDNTEMMDLRVASTLGMSDTDITILRGIEGVEAVMPARELDTMATIDSNQYVVRVHSLPASATRSVTTGDNSVSSDDPNYLNRLVLAEGRFPSAPGECVISADAILETTLKIGDTVVCNEGTLNIAESLVTNTYTIVGFVHSPYYIGSTNMGSSSLGSGEVDTYMYIPETDFSSSVPYTEAFITVTGAAKLVSGSEEYQALINEVKARIDAIAPARAAARTAEVKAEAQQAIDDAAADAYSQLNSAAAQIASGSAEYDAYLQEYYNGTISLEAAREATAQEIASSRAALYEAQSEYSASLAELEEQLPLLQAAEAVAYKIYINTPESSLLYDSVKQVYETASAYRQEAEGGIAQLEAALQMIDAALAQLDAAEQEANAQFAAAQAQLDAAAIELENGALELANSIAEYDAAVEMTEEELENARRQADEIAAAEWYVLDRTKNYGAESYIQDSNRINSIATAFPLFFFLVAALVALTTMTRMIEEERVLIGTYKALGYSKGRISSKYLLYATFASVLGSIIGLAIFPIIIPRAIMAAYTIMYYVPCSGTPLDPGITLLAASLGIGITLIATWAAASATLREKPASLMLPRAPKAGKRILLERIPAIWHRMNFSWKVTFRNLFLYKKRFIMTIIGIAGCTALVLTGLGLKGSIDDIMNIQYSEITNYDARVSVSENQSEEDRAQLDALINNKSKVSLYTWTGSKSMQVCPEGRSNLAITVVVPQNVSAMSELINWRNRQSGETQHLSDEGVLLTEKVASVMNVEVGDTIRVYDQDITGMVKETFYDIPVIGIVENYVLHYAYITPTLYEKIFKEPATYNAILMQLAEGFDQRDAFGAEIRAINGVKTITFTGSTVDSYKEMLKSMDLVVWILILAAGALAFIVLYNLININICERVREIATLKVLGFLPKEVSAYIYRETLLLSIVGALVGLVLGIFLEGYVITSAEVDQVMWGRTIHLSSYLISFVLTMVFTLFVMLVMHRKLRNVDMVESLKSIE